MSDEDLPFRCGRCGAFVGQERLHEADDFGPAPCKRCAHRSGEPHSCESCPTCGVHDGRHDKCCGCYDGVCCQEPADL